MMFEKLAGMLKNIVEDDELSQLWSSIQTGKYMEGKYKY